MSPLSYQQLQPCVLWWLTCLKPNGLSDYFLYLFFALLLWDLVGDGFADFCWYWSVGLIRSWEIMVCSWRGMLPIHRRDTASPQSLSSKHPTSHLEERYRTYCEFNSHTSAREGGPRYHNDEQNKYYQIPIFMMEQTGSITWYDIVDFIPLLRVA